MEKTNALNENQLNISELTKILTNIGESYHRTKMPNSQISELKRLFQEENFETLKKMQPLRKTHPRVTPPEVVRRILELSLEHPAWGCIRISELLKTEKIMISPPTVQSILNSHHIGKRYERARVLEEKAYAEKLVLSSEQIKTIEKINPCFKERLKPSERPGELLVHDVFLLTTLKGVGKIFVQVVVDIYGGYVFCRLDSRKIADCAVMLLHNEVIPFYKQYELKIQAIMTDNGREFCGKEKHHYELYLLLNDIEHRKLPLHQAQDNGYLLRFRRLIENDFWNNHSKEKSYHQFDELASDLQKWLSIYNSEYPLVGYPNLGQPPQRIFDNYILNINQK